MENERKENESDELKTSMDAREPKSDVHIKLGADPDDLEAAIRTIAYHQGYRVGMFDAFAVFLFALSLIGLMFILRGRE